MKNKRFWILPGVIVLILAAGCGKDDESISNNIVSEGNVMNLGASSDATPGNIGDNAAGDVSDNMAGSASDNVVGEVSGNITGSITDETQDVLPDNIPGEIAGSLYAGHTNNIFIANMSGKDIESLTFTFSTDAGARDILGEEELKDGNLFAYTAADINFLQQTSGLRLKVTAIADDETIMEFPEIRVINIAGSTIVLSRGQSTSENQVGYEAYIQ